MLIRQVYKPHILAHIAACSPSTLRSVLAWAKSQGVANGFVQNVNELKHEGKIFVSADDEDSLVLEVA